MAKKVNEVRSRTVQSVIISKKVSVQQTKHCIVRPNIIRQLDSNVFMQFFI
jgi:hypothetical protein